MCLSAGLALGGLDLPFGTGQSLNVFTASFSLSALAGD